MSSPVLLSARGLSAGYRDGAGTRQILAGVDLDLPENRIIGLAGESGCGKSTLALAMAGYRPPGLRLLCGSVTFRGERIDGLSARQLRRYWGRHLAYLPQDTATALNPALRIGRQLAEVFQLHKDLDRRAALAAGTGMLRRVGIPDPERAMHRYPHEFSGGQQQRIAIAIALGPGPEVVILDEPTTGLDVTVQALVNALIVDLIRAERMTALYVSHNLALLAVLCDELRILYAGQVVEAGAAEQVYFSPEHPYTRDLVAAVPHHLDDKPVRGIGGTPPPSVVLDRCAFGPRCGFLAEGCAVPVPLVTRPNGREVRCVRAGDLNPAPGRTAGAALRGGDPDGLTAAAAPDSPGFRTPPLLAATEVGVAYTHAGRSMTALHDLSLSIGPGEVVGVVGESGSGKSTLLRALAGLLVPRSGTLEVNGAAVPWPVGRRGQDIRREIQIVFQNPDASLNPRQTVGAILDHPLRKFRPDLDRGQRRLRIGEVFGQLRLSAELFDRYPAALSGGQRQRVALARALVADPAVVLCDEITSALDVSVQASILELLGELRRASGLAMIFVTHDLGVLRAVADRALVLESGHVREAGVVSQLLETPRHDYTATLVRSIPDPAAHHAGRHRAHQPQGGSDESRVPR
ncbi:MAG TPA: ABC transporter ATP-binding protein [Streptosporangiaceae bacterium]|nr:ABC transporter ATP-binding protein [Streptosporangiaceae bacterium]HEX5290297.1 ABC transporter ATP-binding protein [Streptosporangiaceae bacterium]